MDEQSLDNLVGASCRGDQAAYSELMGRYYQPVYLYCLGCLGDVHDAEDITQEVFFKGYTKLAQLKQPDKFAAWIGRIASNQCKQHRRGRVPRVAMTHEPTAPPEDAHRELRELIARMPLELRLPLVMYYFDGRNVKSVAELMHISVSNAYSRIRQATQALQELFSE